MIIMTVRLTLLPEKTADVANVIGSIRGPISAEAACANFSLYRNLNDTDELMLLSAWESQEALEQHVRSNAFGRVLEMMELACEPPEIAFNTVSDTVGFELVEELRG